MKKKNQKQKKIIFIGISILLIIAIATIALLFFMNESKKDEFAYTQLLKDIQEGKVEKVEMTVNSTSVKVKMRDKEEPEKVIVPNVQAFIELIQNKVEQGSQIEVIQHPQSIFTQISSVLFSLLPTLMMLLLIVLIFKMQGLGEKGKIYDASENDTKVRFEDIAGLEEEKKELQEIVEFLEKPKKFTNMGAKVPKGVLLCGKPGTGKTLIAKAIAGEAGVPFISMSGSEFIEMFAGLGASRVRKLFDKARKMAPCIVFIDEIDAIGSRRTSSSGAETENNQTLNQLLVEMDGFDSNATIIVLAATNRPEMLDTALLRPGRFDRQITIAPPDLRGREAILKIHSKDKKIADDISLNSIAEDTAGFTGAELANVLNEAAILATINGHEEIEKLDLEEAVKKVTVGLQKTSRVISEKDKKLTAYHEAGHAIVSKFLTTSFDVKEVSIIPRGVAGGYTMYKTNEDKVYISKTEMEEKLIALFGGRAAEKVALNEISTGASNDIEVATNIARDMITIYGMSDNVGPITIKKDDPYQIQLLGKGIEDEVGREIREVLDYSYKRAQEILLEHMNKLHEIASVLIQKETISESEFEAFFKE